MRFVCMACQEDLVQLHLALHLSLMLSANHMPNLARCANHMPNLASASGASSAFAAMGPTAQGFLSLRSPYVGQQLRNTGYSPCSATTTGPRYVDTNSISTFELVP